MVVSMGRSGGGTAWMTWAGTESKITKTEPVPRQLAVFDSGADGDMSSYINHKDSLVIEHVSY